MCDIKQTQTQTQTQLVNETENNSDAESDFNQEDDFWGKLIPIGNSFEPIELRKDVTTFGRKETCDVRLMKNSEFCQVSVYSMTHFTIKREFSFKTGSHALLEDNSSNGTFINGEKLGKGKIQALKNFSEIALSRKDNKAYMFIDLSNKDDQKWPPEITKNYTITKSLGVGAYGEVRLAFLKNTCEKYAIKIVSKKKFTMNGRHQTNLTSQITSEIEILKKINHPCIIKIKEVIECPDSVFIVLELVEGGELFDKITRIGQYDEKTAKLLFYQMVQAIKYLHDNGITHRDLKPENILLSDDKNETLVKITDFGLSKIIDSASLMKTFCGTPNYLAPEILISKGEGAYTSKIDNWSLGVILYICLVGYPPFTDENKEMSLEKQIKTGAYDFPDVYWKHISKEAKDVLKKLLCVDPTKRATLEEILEHKWIKNDKEMKVIAHSLMTIACDERQEANAKRNINQTSSNKLDIDHSDNELNQKFKKIRPN